MESPSYFDYVSNKPHIDDYKEYQKKYAENIRESDRKAIEYVKSVLSPDHKSLLDIGSSTGNFLRHVKNMVEGLSLAGIDMMEDLVQECKNDASLQGIEFYQKDVLKMTFDKPFDIVTVNAVFFALKLEEFEKAIASVSSCLSSGGYLVNFDYYHPFDNQLEIKEISPLFPNGLMLYPRSYNKTKEILEANNFEDIKIEPFEIPIDLPVKDNSGTNTHTVKTEEGKRLCFRGMLCQPWSFLVARKK